MKRVSVTALGASLALVLVGGACKNTATDQATPTVAKTISIGQCVTAPDNAAVAAKTKGVDYRTQLKTQGKLTVGSDIAFPPFESVNATTNQAEGFDVDLGKEIARRLGLEIEFINTSFDALFTQSLPQGQFDVGISAITVKPERQQSVDFTVPYFKADLSLAATKDAKITDIKDLKAKLIGAQAGTTGEDCSKIIKDKVGASDVRTFETALQAFDDLSAKRIQGVINDLPSSKKIVEKHPDLLIVETIDTKEVYSIAISKDKPDLRIAINGVLIKMFRDGRFSQIYKMWFKVSPPFDLPPASFPK